MNKILVVDDDEDIASIVCLIMQMNGFDCHYITDHNDFFNKVEDINPDLLIIDVRLKEADGRELCKEIKTDNKYPYLPVILFSANTNVSGNLNEYKADAFIPKPFETSHLIDTVQSLIEKRPLSFS